MPSLPRVSVNAVVIFAVGNTVPMLAQILLTFEFALASDDFEDLRLRRRLAVGRESIARTSPEARVGFVEGVGGFAKGANGGVGLRGVRASGMRADHRSRKDEGGDGDDETADAKENSDGDERESVNRLRHLHPSFR